MENFVLYFKNILTKYVSDVTSYLHFPMEISHKIISNKVLKLVE